MSQLKVYRASAGSGKTYTLTKEYLRLLFENPTSYRHTLAVTFTNKATAEMRSRILETLYNLSDRENKNPDHMNELIEELTITKEEVRVKSAALLKTLLHDYSRFSISTIDSFFQRVTRSFAREMGLPIGFRLELESNLIMQQAIDQLILEMDLPHNKELKKWLIQFAQDRIEKNQSWNIVNEIKNLGGEIVKERFQTDALTLSDQIRNREFLNTYKKALEEIIDNINNQIVHFGKKALVLIKNYNLDIDTDFKGKSRSPIRIFNRLIEINKNMSWSELNNIYKPDLLIKIADSVDSLLAKSATDELKNSIETLYNKGIQGLAKNTANYLLGKREDYFTAKLILVNLNALGLVNDLNEKMMEICREKNIFLISGTNYLLSRIIDNNETPFIYEKTGARFSNFMIDEFQDTSNLQYLNFLPLINDSLATDSYSLVVGDIKQAIYRWRNSDWNILAEKVENDFNKYGVHLEKLSTNWRSAQELISFNNLLFQFASETLQNDFNNLLPDDNGAPHLDYLKTKITSAYNDVFQKQSPNTIKGDGQVQMTFIDGDTVEEFQEKAVQQSIKRIEELIEEGFKFSDVAILVRTNKEAVRITNALLAGEYSEENKSFPVISNESLIIGNSEAIQLIVAQLEYILNPNNQILESFIRLHLLKDSQNIDKNGFLNISDSFLSRESNELWENYKKTLFANQQKPLYELIEVVSSLIPADMYSHHMVYIQGFLSVALNFINTETADINQFITFWHNRGSRLSLSVPDNQDAIQVMTIHKSKGLEFKAVVIPFIDWEINSLRYSDFLWLKPTKAPFNAVSIVPIDGVKAVGYSHFANDYFDEILLNYVDTLNVAYVALTRAKKSLSLFGYNSSKKSKNVNTFAILLNKFVSSSPFKKKYSGSSMEEDEQFFSIGKVLKEQKESKKESKTHRKSISTPPAETIYTPISNRIKNHLESEHSFDKSEQTQKLYHGKIMHQLFELIIDEKDIDSALMQLRLQGIVEGKEIELLQSQIKKYMNHPKAKNWFNNHYQVKTEPTILAKEIKRPDRVMMNSEEIIVVDYKFGTEKSPNHYRQVQNYLHLIHQIERKKISGFLWYMENNEIIEVNMQGRLF